MKNVLIIEDEPMASQNLKKLLDSVAPNVHCVGVIQSVEETVDYFSTHPDVDAVFMDIHLADGLAFRIFDKVKIEVPIIFTTAYDQYALDAFRVNGIDYLLKPINKEDLARAINKLDRYDKSEDDGNLDNLVAMMSQQMHHYKSYFLIPQREKLVPLAVNTIAYLYIDDKMTRAVTFDNKQFYIDKPLDNIMSQLDPSKFFRANRQYILAHSAVESIQLWPLNKLYIQLRVSTPEKILIPRSRTSEFKEWYTR